jgi:phosphoserine aminotransferase
VAKKAIKEAKFYGEVEIVASSEDKNYSYIPKGYTIPADADYFHITTNNTIYGTELHEDIDSPVPLMANMSSDIMSRPVDVSKYGIIYGGAQKNVGPAGVAFVIVREDILGKLDRPLQTMVDYRTHIRAAEKDRSIMNVCFVMKEEYKDKEAAFLEFSKERSMVGIKGHRSVGGFRASIYNACPREAVEALIQCMQDFEKQV